MIMNNDIFSVFNTVFILIIKIISTGNNEPEIVKPLRVSSNTGCIQPGDQFGNVI